MFSRIKLFLLIILMTLFSSSVLGNYDKLAYDFNFKDLDGSDLKLNEYKDKVIIVINDQLGTCLPNMKKSTGVTIFLWFLNPIYKHKNQNKVKKDIKE